MNSDKRIQAGCVVVLLLIACLVCFLWFESESRQVTITEDTYGSGKIVDPSNYVPRGELTDEKIINGLMADGHQTKKGVTRKTRNPLNLLVAGAGFEPTTSGL